MTFMETTKVLWFVKFKYFIFKSMIKRARATAEICANPVAIEAVRAIDGVDALSTGDVFKFFSPRKGLLCEDSDQVSY